MRKQKKPNFAASQVPLIKHPGPLLIAADTQPDTCRLSA